MAQIVQNHHFSISEAFAPFVDEVAEQTLTHLRFIFHDGVRSSAAETVPLLIECVKPQVLQIYFR